MDRESDSFSDPISAQLPGQLSFKDLMKEINVDSDDEDEDLDSGSERRRKGKSRGGKSKNAVGGTHATSSDESNTDDEEWRPSKKRVRKSASSNAVDKTSTSTSTSNLTSMEADGSTAENFEQELDETQRQQLTKKVKKRPGVKVKRKRLDPALQVKSNVKNVKYSFESAKTSKLLIFCCFLFFLP